MRRPLFAALILALLPLSAAAQCLNGGSIDRGVVFTRQNGDKGLVTRKGDMVAVDYVTNRPSVTDFRHTRAGVFEVYWSHYPYGPDFVGAGTVITETTFAKRLPAPAEGAAFQTGWRARVTDHAPVEGGPILSRAKGSSSYLYQQIKEVKLSGCTYRAMGVEATIQTDQGWTKRRWIYFPDLGFALETRVTTATDDRKLGLTAMVAK